MRLLSIISLVTLWIIATSCDRRSPGDKRLCNALERGDTNEISLFLASGGGVNTQIQCGSHDPTKVPLLDIAILFARLDCVALLLNKGADPPASWRCPG